MAQFHLTPLVHKLNERLRDKSTQLEALRKEQAERRGDEYQDPEADKPVLDGIQTDPELEAQLKNQLSLHVLGPLIQAYESDLSTLR